VEVAGGARLTMRIGVIFPGQGSQFVGMGGALAEVSPVAAALYERANAIVGYDLRAIVERGPEELLRETHYSQPAIFLVNYALFAAVGEALKPVASAAHSFGEYCSLVVAGALTFDEALRLVNERSLAMQAAAEAAPGGMSAILGLDVERLRRAVGHARDEGRVQLANFNAPGQIVISGDTAAVRRAGELALEAGAKRVIALNVSGAWHSELMIPARERFAAFVAGAEIAPPRIDVISNVDAKPYRDVATIRHNLVRSVTDEVLWHETALRLIDERLDLIVEFGGSPVLWPMLKRLPHAPEGLHVGDPAGVERLASKLAAKAAV
jgi:[acyl-carrier-protein] S-malonyltransferase